MGKRIRLHKERKGGATAFAGGSRSGLPYFSSFEALLEYCTYRPVSASPCNRFFPKSKPPSSASPPCPSSSTSHPISCSTTEHGQSRKSSVEVTKGKRKRRAISNKILGESSNRNKDVKRHQKNKTKRAKKAAVDTIDDLHGDPTLTSKGESTSVQQVVKGSPKKVKRPKSPQLTAAQKRSEAYRYVPADHPWVPPSSPHQLLQESHHSDHWRVLIICLLCNRTTGKQVEKVLPEFFYLCPSAAVTVNVPTQAIMEKIRCLGFQKCRAITIKRLSEAYLRDWSYVTELPGIGKYAADAYAIFCSGHWKAVSPVDHKLVDYWKFLHKEHGLPDPL